MRVLSITLCILVCAAPGFSQSPELKTAGAVLERYQQALGGPRAIQRVQAEVVRGEVESSNGSAEPVRAEFVYYAKPFRTLYKVTHADIDHALMAGIDGRARVGSIIAGLGYGVQVRIAQSDTNAAEVAVGSVVVGLVGEGVVLRAHALGLGDLGIDVVTVEKELAARLIDEDSEADIASKGIVVADLLCGQHGAVVAVTDRVARDGQPRIDDEEADARVDEHVDGGVGVGLQFVSDLAGSLDRIEDEARPAVAHPYDVLPSGNAFVLEGDLLEGVEGLAETLPEERRIHLLERVGCGQVIEGEEQVGAAAGEALDHLERFVTHDQHLGRSGKLLGLGKEKLARRPADVSKVLKGGVEEIKNQDGGGGFSVGVFAGGFGGEEVLLGRFEGEDSLRLFVFGDGEIVAGEASDDRVILLIEHGDVEEDESRCHAQGGRIRRGLTQVLGRRSWDGSLGRRLGWSWGCGRDGQDGCDEETSRSRHVKTPNTPFRSGRRTFV
jgi:hypothetical protein